jgi:hypothetical protein
MRNYCNSVMFIIMGMAEAMLTHIETYIVIQNCTKIVH